MSVPKPGLTTGLPGLPQPLAPSDAARLVRIFELQSQGDSQAAARESERLDDRRLMGHVLAHRWLQPRAIPPGTPELTAWLAAYSDHPEAGELHEMLRRRLPATAPQPPAPRDDALASEEDVVPEERDPASRTIRRNPALDKLVRGKAAEGDTPGALAAIARGASGAYAALLQAEVALVDFHQGQPEQAWQLASEVARLNPDLAFPAFVAGLAAWKMNQLDVALSRFEAAARAETGPPALRAAASFWTARAAVRTRRPQLYVPWMLQAAQEPRTFYGLVARRVLGLSTGFAWERDTPGTAEGAALAETAGGWRALALLQVGQRGLAEQELRRLRPIVKGNPALSSAMLTAASAAGMTELASQVAALAQTADGRPRDYDRFPMPQLKPLNGFRVDPSLLYALALQESRFDADAVSPAGARGMMQIMPATASFITNDPSLRGGAGQQRLHDPAFSLELAQRYLHHLTAREALSDDLIRILAAYNNGPGNVARWAPGVRDGGDPFLFLESIPVGETRAFVQRVLAYSWIYANRLGLPSPSLEALARGEFPRFGGSEIRSASR
jgi:soluble lytic murein transglycosylase-like protein